jgi:O-antigen/teichoic acid export membrane protein
MLRVLGLSQLIHGLHNTATYLLRRNLAFGHYFILHGSEAVAYTVVVVAAGPILHNAWALVLAVVISYATRVTASYFVTDVHPRLGFDRAKFKEMFEFSRWTSAFSVVDFALEAGDNTVVGAALGPSALAFYRMGYQVSTEGSSALQLVLTPVAFPAMSRMQFDLERVRSGFRTMLGLSLLAILPLTGGLILFAPLAVPLLLGDRWSPAVGPLRILALAALFRGILEIARPVLLGLGRSRDDFALKLFQVILMLALAYPAAVSGGIIGVSVAVLAAAVATLPAWAYALVRTAHVAWSDVTRPVLAPILSGAIAIGTLLVVMAPGGGWAELLVYVALYGVLYAGTSLVLRRVLPGSGLALWRRSG